MTAERYRSLLDQLQQLLESQLESARRSDFRRVDQIARQTATLIEDIAVAVPAENSLFREQRHRIAKLHRQLVLTLVAEKEKVGAQLKKLGAGKKTVEAYRNNV